MLIIVVKYKTQVNMVQTELSSQLEEGDSARALRVPNIPVDNEDASEYMKDHIMELRRKICGHS